MGKRKKVRSGIRYGRTDEEVQAALERSGLATGTPLCEVPGCAGDCGGWHVL